MPLRILNVAYPLIPVTAEAPGGSEQILQTLLTAFAENGHSVETTTIAHPASQVQGRLVPLRGRLPEGNIEQSEFERIVQKQNELALDLLSSERFDLVHNQGGLFYRAAAQSNTPVLMTLHLAEQLYESAFFENLPPNLYLQCVSKTQYEMLAKRLRQVGLRADAPGEVHQRRTGAAGNACGRIPHNPPQGPALAGWVGNGIALDRFRFLEKKSDYVLYVGRICEEKGPHLAIEVAQKAGVHLFMLGAIYPFAAHQQYFARNIRPHLGHGVTFVENPTLAQKRAALAGARAVLIPSLVAETSSLVAMEAAGSGTPVIAFRHGALPEIVEHTISGFIADDVASMQESVARSGEISPARCRAVAEERFTASRMADGYVRLYQSVIASEHRESRKPAPAQSRSRPDAEMRPTL
jgi:glycosyltransferase involved in cell wall biosynthesis